MKKRIALLLAAAITTTMLPVNAFAGSNNYLYATPGNVQKLTVMAERTAHYLPTGYSTSTSPLPGVAIGTAASDAGLKVTLGAATTDPTFGRVFKPNLDIAGHAVVVPEGATAPIVGAPWAGPINMPTLATTPTNYVIAPYPGTGAGGNYNGTGIRVDSVGARAVYSNSDIQQVVPGADLVIVPDTDITPGSQFRLTLTNGTFFFRNVDTGSTNKYAPNPAKNSSTGTPVSGIFQTGIPSEGIPALVRTETVTDPATTGTPITAQVKYDLKTTYDVSRGVWTPAGTTYGTYTRVGNNGGIANNVVVDTGLNYIYMGTNYREAPYTMSISSFSESEAIVTFPEGVTQGLINTPGSTRYAVVIPMVIRSTAENDVTVKIDSILSTITPQTLYIGSSGLPGTGLTNTWVKDPVTSRYDFPNTRIQIDELRLGSLSNGRITLRAPRGFYFSDPKLATLKTYIGASFGTTTLPQGNYKMSYRSDSYYYSQGLNQSIVEIDIYNLVRASTMYGTLYIEGLKLYADETAPDGPIGVTIEGYEFEPGTTTVSSRQMVTTQTFTAGTRNAWVSTLTTSGTIPTLFTGRYDRDFDATISNSTDILNAMINAEDYEHKTATVTFQEEAVNAWWARRVTDLVLSPNAKFRKIKMNHESTDKIVDKALLTNTEYYPTLAGGSGAGKGVYLNDGIRHGNVIIDGGKLTFANLTVDTANIANRGKLVFDCWVSIEAGKPGDVTLTARGTIPVNTTASATDINVAGNPTCKIATAIDPVKVTVDTIADLKIGYQYQPAANITITEQVDPTTGRTGLKRNRQVLITVTDLISTDLLFAPETVAKVTNGLLNISRVTSITNGYAARDASSLYGAGQNNGGTIGFTVMNESQTGKPSTITLSNVQVKVDRSVPESNINTRNYKVLVWGTAIGENFGRARDQFSSPGIQADFARVVSTANDKSGIINQEVKVPIGESYYMVGSKTVDMPSNTSAYISPASNSTMVPVRFVANALGINDDQIIYDDAKKTVTIITPSRVVQFTTDSSTMTINGSQISMLSPDKLAVKAENKNDRVYIPFRALGEAMGIRVSFDAATQVATYSPAATTAASASASPSASPSATAKP